jgi:hypothetical protein
VRGAGLVASPAEREERVRKQFTDLLSVFAPGVPDAAFRPVIDELVGKVLAGMDPPPGDSPVAATAARPDSADATETGHGAVG